MEPAQRTAQIRHYHGTRAAARRMRTPNKATRQGNIPGEVLKPFGFQMVSGSHEMLWVLDFCNRCGTQNSPFSAWLTASMALILGPSGPSTLSGPMLSLPLALLRPMFPALLGQLRSSLTFRKSLKKLLGHFFLASIANVTCEDM